ncbi:alpha/beta fold hydrolase [Candidatus Solirubrobacter pratensis]|uniref:alpha/beta fold hydrolase n=1 Tax=Candidatus Solirubrobacter pratensis TaxID=1298857 RepID=UPI0009DBB296|nr:alpha/beta hydrolase [Candidatus Solirubrobacter pratensis]
MTRGDSGRCLRRKSEPFQTYFDVPVAGGALTVARAGQPPDTAQAVVLALHGMTGTHMIYRTVARELCDDERGICVLAPDLRGRGRSAHLPEPHGMAAHVADLVAVLDHVGVETAVLVGHSMGCNVVARFAADHPARTAAVILLDSGVPILPEKVASEGTPGLFDRFEATFPSGREYLAYWRGHPGLKDAWDEDVDEFVHHDFVEDENGAHCLTNVDVVLADVADLTYDGVTWRAVTRVSAPVRLMRAERGMYDDDPLIPLSELDDFLREHPHVSVELVPDVNHFTLVIGGGHGPRRVAATMAELAVGEMPESVAPKR